MFEAVIFDWDGTLADTKNAILFSFHKALQHVGADVVDDQINRRIGIGAAETFREILRVQNVQFDEELIRRLVKLKVNAELEVSDKTQLFDGALDLLNSLKGRVKLGLASMKNRPLIEYLLDSTKTRNFFDVVVAIEEIQRHKPDPEIFLKTAKELKIEPHKCIVIEDSIFGVQAAKKAKMACIAVAQGAYSKVELKDAHADLVVSSLLDKHDILSFIL